MVLSLTTLILVSTLAGGSAASPDEYAEQRRVVAAFRAVAAGGLDGNVTRSPLFQEEATVGPHPLERFDPVPDYQYQIRLGYRDGWAIIDRRTNQILLATLYDVEAPEYDPFDWEESRTLSDEEVERTVTRMAKAVIGVDGVRVVSIVRVPQKRPELRVIVRVEREGLLALGHSGAWSFNICFETGRMRKFSGPQLPNPPQDKTPVVTPEWAIASAASHVLYNFEATELELLQDPVFGFARIWSASDAKRARYTPDHRAQAASGFGHLAYTLTLIDPGSYSERHGNYLRWYAVTVDAKTGRCVYVIDAEPYMVGGGAPTKFKSELGTKSIVGKQQASWIGSADRSQKTKGSATFVEVPLEKLPEGDKYTLKVGKLWLRCVRSKAEDTVVFNRKFYRMRPSDKLGLAIDEYLRAGK